MRPPIDTSVLPQKRGLGCPDVLGELARPKRDAEAKPGYYDVPMLKPPVWENLISWYFFLGGVSAGAYVTARMAERFGGTRFRAVTREATAVAAVAALPTTPLLITDLGDPKRFHHMLRVFKPESPMNLGAWVLTAYHGAGACALAREWLRQGKTDHELKNRGFLQNAVDGLLVAVADVAGIPLALLLASYTGVLLTGGATPVWCKNKWLPALFSASAMSSGAAAVGLELELLNAAGFDMNLDVTREPLQALHSVSHLAEVVTLVGYLSSIKRPIPRAWGTFAAIAGSELLKQLPAGKRLRSWLDIGSAALGLVGAYHLRATIMQAGRDSANDPRSRA
jgi:formate-dependent nitrite reductase membrane component NrfD